MCRRVCVVTKTQSCYFPQVHEGNKQLKKESRKRSQLIGSERRWTMMADI